MHVVQAKVRLKQQLRAGRQLEGAGATKEEDRLKQQLRAGRQLEGAGAMKEEDQRSYFEDFKDVN
jgi:hypothetical protein